MSDLTASHCGCSQPVQETNCGCGGSWIWIILLLCCCGGNKGGLFTNNGCGDDNGCGCGNWIWIILLLCCCGGNGGCF